MRVPIRLAGDMGTGASELAGRVQERQGRPRAWLREALGDVERLSTTVLGMPLRSYQAEVARAVLTAIDAGRGHTLTVLMPRQSGKNQITAGRP